MIFETNGLSSTKTVSIKPNSERIVNLSDLVINNPKLWWPNGYGKANLYDGKFSFVKGKTDTLDQENIKFGIRNIQIVWNEHTQSAKILVNGQKIFIKGGNWIISDALLRLSSTRYDNEVRFHRDMNLNLIRIWGGALLERPEFYNACDKY